MGAGRLGIFGILGPGNWALGRGYNIMAEGISPDGLLADTRKFGCFYSRSQVVQRQVMRMILAVAGCALVGTLSGCDTELVSLLTGSDAAAISPADKTSLAAWRHFLESAGSDNMVVGGGSVAPVSKHTDPPSSEPGASSGSGQSAEPGASSGSG